MGRGFADVSRDVSRVSRNTFRGFGRDSRAAFAHFAHVSRTFRACFASVTLDSTRRIRPAGGDFF
eukprot:4543282-Prymnesium_polylepis.1